MLHLGARWPRVSSRIGMPEELELQILSIGMDSIRSDRPHLRETAAGFFQTDS